MPRKNVITPTKIFENGDMSGNLVSAEYDTQWMDNVGIIVAWNGTTPVGAITIDVKNGDSEWSELDFGSTIDITGNTGNHNININQTPFEKFRVNYNFGSGTGLINAVMTAKML